MYFVHRTDNPHAWKRNKKKIDYKNIFSGWKLVLVGVEVLGCAYKSVYLRQTSPGGASRGVVSLA